jgi:hypothetical protein
VASGREVYFLSEEPNQLIPHPNQSNQSNLPATPGFSRTIEEKPATVSVTAGSGVVKNIGDNQITERAEHIRYSTDESMIWQEAPSLTLLVPRAVKYVVLLAILFFVCSEINSYLPRIPAAREFLTRAGIQTPVPVYSSATRHGSHKKHHASADDSAATDTTATDSTTTGDASTSSDTAGNQPIGTTPLEGDDAPSKPLTLAGILFDVKCAFVALYLLLFGLYFFKLKTTRYCASSQRLIVEEGRMHTVNRPYELHKLGDAVIVTPVLLRMFNVSHLVITDPHIELVGLRNASYVRDILRQGGQLEAQRTDKIRYR